MTDFKHIDLHMHSTVSDGTDTPSEIVCRVREAGIDLFSLTDHDAYSGCLEIQEELKSEGQPAFLTGIEFSCKDDEGKYHILGYGYDPAAESMQAVVKKGHGFRLKKLRARLEYLESEYGFTFTEEERYNLFHLHNPGKPHIGRLMAEHGYAKDKDEAIKKYINGRRFRSEYIRPDEAIEGIVKAGGIPVLAHPIYGSGDDLILGEEMEERLKKLIGFGLEGVEAFYSGFTPKLRETMLAFAKKYALLVTAGSDYHGGNKMINLGDTGCQDPMNVPELVRFLEKVLA